MLSVSNLDFSYGSTEVLHDITFDIEENKIVSILGPNGVGKTTLLRCICNFHRPSHGNMTVDGTDITKLPLRELAKYIAYVPQISRASKATVFDTILIGRRPFIEWSISRDDIKMVWDIIDELKMRPLALKYVDEISGGEY